LLALLAVLPALSADPEPAEVAGRYAPAESAAVARAEWAAMRKARAAGDHRAAVAHAKRAHLAWPGQWVYAYGLASTSAAIGDAPMVWYALNQLFALGAAPDLSRDTTLVAFSQSAIAGKTGIPQAMLNIRVRSGPGMKGIPAFSLPAADSTFWPEGIAYDSTSRAFYLTGVREGRVVRVDRDRRPHEFARVERGWSALAVAVDPARDLVWATSAALPQSVGYAPADSGRAAILAFDRSTGDRRLRFELPAASEGHVPGDIQVAPDGDVFVSDSAHPAIYRIHGGKLETFVTDPGFRSLQGQALSMDSKVLFVADYSHGIAAIDRATRVVRWIPSRAKGSTLGVDGLLSWGSSLIGVQNGIVPPRVVLFTLDQSGDITAVDEVVRDPVHADEPTMLVRAENQVLFVANSQWEKYDDRGVRRPGTRLEPARVLQAPLRITYEIGNPEEVRFECGTP
jgi:hypothetical protein